MGYNLRRKKNGKWMEFSDNENDFFFIFKNVESWTLHREK